MVQAKVIVKFSFRINRIDFKNNFTYQWNCYISRRRAWVTRGSSVRSIPNSNLLADDIFSSFKKGRRKKCEKFETFLVRCKWVISWLKREVIALRPVSVMEVQCRSESLFTFSNFASDSRATTCYVAFYGERLPESVIVVEVRSICVNFGQFCVR